MDIVLFGLSLDISFTAKYSKFSLSPNANSLLKMDVTGLVLAAETAIGHNPIGVTQMVKSIQNLYNLQSNSLTFLHQYVPTSKFDSSILGVWMGR